MQRAASAAAPSATRWSAAALFGARPEAGGRRLAEGGGARLAESVEGVKQVACNGGRLRGMCLLAPPGARNRAALVGWRVAGHVAHVAHVACPRTGLGVASPSCARPRCPLRCWASTDLPLWEPVCMAACCRAIIREAPRPIYSIAAELTRACGKGQTRVRWTGGCARPCTPSFPSLKPSLPFALAAPPTAQLVVSPRCFTVVTPCRPDTHTRCSRPPPVCLCPLAAVACADTFLCCRQENRGETRIPGHRDPDRQPNAKRFDSAVEGIVERVLLEPPSTLPALPATAPSLDTCRPLPLRAHDCPASPAATPANRLHRPPACRLRAQFMRLLVSV